MRKYSLLIIVMLLSGCGSSGDSSVDRDGKGEIDVASYLPVESMVKNYEEYGFRYHGTAQEIITVDNQTITIKYTQAPSTYMLEGRNYTSIIKYNDVNITTYSKNNIVNTKFRYVNNKEIISESTSETTEEYKCQNISEGCSKNEVIGILDIKNDHKCFYEHVNEIKSSDNTQEGDFLKVKCESNTYRIITINSEYINSDNINWRDGRGGYGSESIAYYKKGIGLYKRRYSPYYLVYKNNAYEKVYGAPGGSGRSLMD